MTALLSILTAPPRPDPLAALLLALVRLACALWHQADGPVRARAELVAMGAQRALLVRGVPALVGPEPPVPLPEAHARLARLLWQAALLDPRDPRWPALREDTEALLGEVAGACREVV